MRNKKIFSFNEEKDAEAIILNGFPNGIIDYSKMYLIAKYFRQKLNLGEIRLEKELIKFCKSQDENFNSVIEAESIKKWIKSAMNYDLRKINSVIISQKEVDFLKEIENARDRKLLFITLVLSKALKQRGTRRNKSELKTSDNYYIRYSNFMDIIKISQLTNLGEFDLADIFYKYKEHFIFYSAEREVIRINFVDKNPEIEITIDNMDKILDYYDLFFGKHRVISNCESCGKEIRKTNNSQKYCKECSIEIKRIKTKMGMRKIRKNKM